MVKIGYFLSSEEYGPAELVAQARAAEAAGFEGLWISDHLHPWNDEQGQSPFVWSVIGEHARVRGRGQRPEAHLAQVEEYADRLRRALRRQPWARTTSR